MANFTQGNTIRGAFLTSDGVPQDSAGADGDTCRDRVTNDLYERIAGVWVRYYEAATAGGGGGGMVPTYIAPSETFTVPANKQALYAILIDNEGTLDVVGSLVGVD